MDKEILRWILEYFLRQPIADEDLGSLFRLLPLPGDSNFKYCMLLRKLQSEIARGSLSEEILELMQEIERLHYREGVRVPESLKAAYCAVAVNCTVRFLEGDSEDKEAEYFRAVKKIWKHGVFRMEKTELEGLFSEELRNWGDEIIDGVWDSSVQTKLVVKSKDIDALELVRVSVAEAWLNQGPPFLEHVANSLSDNKVREVLGLSIRVSEDLEPVAPDSEPVTQDSEPVAQDSEPVAQDSEPVAQDPEPVAQGSEPIAQNSPVISINKDKGKTTDVPKEKYVARSRYSTRLKAGTIRGAKITDNEEDAADKSRKYGFVDTSQGAKITDDEEVASDKAEKYGFLETQNIDKIQEALKSSAMELKAAVNDPLPDAIHVADTLISEMARNNENVTPQDRSNNSNPISQPNHNLMEPVADTLVSEMARNNENVTPPNRSNNNNPTSQPNHNLMEPNSTARVDEWNDSIEESSSERGRTFSLPTPKKRLISPLKKHRVVKLKKRRTVNRWNEVEEETLREGVKKYGRGNWKLILSNYPNVFIGRTEVDLKDKWRNMVD